MSLHSTPPPERICIEMYSTGTGLKMLVCCRLAGNETCWATCIGTVCPLALKRMVQSGVSAAVCIELMDSNHGSTVSSLPQGKSPILHPRYASKRLFCTRGI